MSIQAVAWALEQDLPARAKLVLVSIANHADHTTGYCWLKAETIAREAACTPRSVYNYVGGLVRNGFIRKALRKGDDGKQRANDYWILFGRIQNPWDWGAHPDENVGDGEASESEPSETEAQDVVPPSEGNSPGETAQPSERDDSRQEATTHELSPGPRESAFTRLESAQPSKTKPKEAQHDFAAPPRTYRPPPQQPQGAVADREAKQIFVYEHTPAYDAWAKEKGRASGVAWHLITTKIVDGKPRRGWYFPSLFPPERHAAGPPTQPEELSEDDREFVKNFK